MIFVFVVLYVFCFFFIFTVVRVKERTVELLCRVCPLGVCFHWGYGAAY